MPLLKDDYTRKEKINGTIYNMSSSGGFMHSQINGNLYHEIRQRLKNSICVVSVENLDLYLSDDEYVIPDVMIICDRNQIKKDKYRGVPKFVAETLSPATSFKDKTIKKKNTHSWELMNIGLSHQRNVLLRYTTWKKEYMN